jgi:hypothetical protein
MPIACFGARSLPSGKSEAELVSIEEVVGRFDNAALRFIFEAMDGPNKGFQARKTVGTNFAEDTTSGQFISQLVGRSLGRDDRIKLNDLIGLRFVLTIAGSQIIKAVPVVKP